MMQNGESVDFPSQNQIVPIKVSVDVIADCFYIFCLV